MIKRLLPFVDSGVNPEELFLSFIDHLADMADEMAKVYKIRHDHGPQERWEKFADKLREDYL